MNLREELKEVIMEGFGLEEDRIRCFTEDGKDILSVALTTGCDLPYQMIFIFAGDMITLQQRKPIDPADRLDLLETINETNSRYEAITFYEKSNMIYMVTRFYPQGNINELLGHLAAIMEITMEEFPKFSSRDLLAHPEKIEELL